MTTPVLTLGSDPEVFVTSDGVKVDAAYYVLGGDIDMELPYGKAYCDGAAIEFTVEPSADPVEFSERLFANYNTIQKFVSERGFMTTLTSYMPVREDHHATLIPEFGKRASLHIFGCNEDFTVYDWIASNPRPDPRTTVYRSIGGHMHIELPEHLRDDEFFTSFLVSVLDQSVGVLSSALHSSVQDYNRRRLYGEPGCHRKPKYGVEYRVPPAAFLLTSRNQTKTVFMLMQKVTQHAIDFYQECNADQKRLLEVLGGLNAVESTISQIKGGYFIKDRYISVYQQFAKEAWNATQSSK